MRGCASSRTRCTTRGAPERARLHRRCRSRPLSPPRRSSRALARPRRRDASSRFPRASSRALDEWAPMSTGGCAIASSPRRPPRPSSRLGRARLLRRDSSPRRRGPAPPRRPASVLADLAASGDAPEVVTRRRSSDDASRRLPRPAAVVLGASALFAAAALPPAAKHIAPSPAVAGASVDVGAPLSNVRNAVAVYREYTPSEIFSYKIQKVLTSPSSARSCACSSSPSP